MEFRTIDVVDTTGKRLPGATLTVYDAGTTNARTAYDENGVEIVGLVSDSKGQASFATENGAVDVLVTLGGNSILLENLQFYDFLDDTRIQDAADAAVVAATAQAEGYRDDAQDAATSAATSAGAADVSAQITRYPPFPDTASGVAGVADGELFVVPETAGQHIYQRNGAVADHYGWLTGPEFPSVSSLLADTSSSFGSPGQIVWAGGFRFEEVASGGDRSTAGGVLLEVLRTANGYEVEAFGTDDDVNAAFEAWKAKGEAEGGDLYIGESHTITDKFVMTNTAPFTRVTFGNGAVLTTDGTNNRALAFNSASIAGITLSVDAAAGDTTVTLTDATDVSVGDLLYIRDSTQTVETTFGSDAQEVNLVSEVSGSDVTFEKPLTFPYTAAGTAIENYGQKTLELVNYNVVGDQARGAGITGFKYPVVSNFTYEQVNRPPPDGGEDGIYSQRNWKLRIKGFNVRFAKYGIVDHASFGTTIEDVDAYDCRHPVDPNSLSQSTLIKNMTARNCNSAINSHAALDVVYDGFLIEEDRGRPLLRGTGGGYRNGTAHYTSMTTSAGNCCLIAWKAAHVEAMQDPRRFEICNVVEYSPASTSNVLAHTITNVGEVRLEDYTTVGVSVGDFANCQRLYTRNLRVGYMRGGATVENRHENLIFDPATNPAISTGATAWSPNGINAEGINPRTDVIGGGVLNATDYAVYMTAPDARIETATNVTGDGSTVTVTHAAATTPFAVGSIVIFRGCNPAGYDGAYTVTASTTTSFSFTASETGTYVSGGTAYSGNRFNFDGVDMRASNYSLYTGRTESLYNVRNCTLSEPISTLITNAADYRESNNIIIA